jgi:hypothetical protein
LLAGLPCAIQGQRCHKNIFGEKKTMSEQFSRRQALAMAGAAGLVAAASPAFGAPDWDKPFDVHAHMEPRTPGYGPFGTLTQMVNQHYQERLDYMDRNGIVRSAVSAMAIAEPKASPTPAP